MLSVEAGKSIQHQQPYSMRLIYLSMAQLIAAHVACLSALNGTKQ